MNKIIPALIMIALIAPGLAVVTSSGTHSIQSTNLQLEGSGVVPDNYTTLQLFSTAPGEAFPLLKELSGGIIKTASSFGYIEEISYPSQYNSTISRDIEEVSGLTGSLSYLNSSASYIPCLSFTPAQSSSGYYTPQNIYEAYSFNSSNSAGITGSGTTIAIVDAYGDPLLRYDISAFDNVTGLPAVNLQTIYMNNTPNAYNQSWAIETALDVEWAHVSAPGAKIVLVISQDAQASLTDALSYVISKHISNIISLSWGEAESSVGSSAIASENTMFLLAAHEGITILAASGDLGAYDGTKILNVNFPASDPYVLGVGGTSLDYNQGKYVETAWGGNQSGTSYGSGGGYSRYFSEPYWQSNSSINATARGVPDVAADANKETGVLLIAGGKSYVAGGTSLATPIWAGIVSRIDQKLGYSVGYLNPLLYQIYRSPLYRTAFNAVTSGSNGYYQASSGWNPVTGLGSPIVSGLIPAVSEIASDYGVLASFRSSYSFYSLNGTLSISNVSHNTLALNGTVFYYLSMYYSNSSYVKFGIALNASGVYSRFSEVDDSYAFSVNSQIGSLKSSLEYRLYLSYNGSYVSTQIDGVSYGTYPIMQSYAGSSAPSIGVEIIRPADNLTVIPAAAFTGVALHNLNNGIMSLRTFELHYSGVAQDQDYSTINVVQNGSSFAFVSGISAGNAYLNGSNSTNTGPCIIYSTVYSSHPTLTFNLTRTETITSWKVNGSVQASNVIEFAHPGNYTVTATYDGGNVSREVVIPVILKTGLLVQNRYPFYKPEINYTLDHSLSGSGLIGTNMSVYGFAGQNMLALNAPGYLASNLTFKGGKFITANLTPLNASVSIFVFTGNATVNLNGTLLSGSMGSYSKSVEPGSYYVNVSAPGFHSKNSTLELSPGQNYSLQYLLVPTEIVYTLQGTVSDAVLKFPIRGVEVSAGGKTYGYSNGSGFYEVFAAQGFYNFTFSSPDYNASILAEHLTSNTTANVGLFPLSVNVSQVYRVEMSFFFPIGYLALYVSWSPPGQAGVQSFRIDYSTNSNMSGYNYVVVSGTSSYTVLFPVTPATTYYVQVLSILSSNQVVAGKIVTLNAASLPDILINLALYIGVITYLVVAIRILRRAFKKKRTD
ncbi:MAG: PEGA domain-containing protein [Candidatus Thermoplasmatota archaeon]|nr:PEGA domain-containing protein [Candidatus Thermoplasmatota archaeon]